MIAGLWFGAALVVLVILRSRVWALTGHDAYYHMRFAAHVLEHGVSTHTLPWLRLSVLADQFGDKEFLFRVFLLPFARMNDLMAGGKLALCVLNALQAAVVAFVGVRWGGRRGAWLPLLILACSMQVWYRLDLLRPHNFSLILLIVAAYLIGRQRYRMLGLLAVVYALSYTAFHTFWILCAGTFALLWFDRRERPWGLLLYPAVGLAVGLALHPAFPHNLVIARASNIDLYVHSDLMNIATEATSGTSFNVLVQSLMGLFLVGVGILTTRPWSGACRPGRQEVILFGFAVAFTVLYFLAYRFIEYAAAFAALYLFLVYNRLEGNPTHAPGDRKPRQVLMAALVVYAVVFNVVFLRMAGLRQGENRDFFESPEAMHAFAEAVPEGAHVAAAWDVTSMYCFAAPHGRYLNQLDPVFMFARDPGLQTMADRLFRGYCSDVVAVAAGLFDSEYIAVQRRPYSARLRQKLDRDARISLVHDGERHMLYRISPVAGFVTDWSIAMEAESRDGSSPPPDSAFRIPGWAWDSWRAWVSPRVYSDWASPHDAGGDPVTWWARRTVEADEDGGPIRVRVGARGRADIRVDGRTVAVCDVAGLVTQGQVEFHLPLEAGQSHRVEVRIESPDGPGGFFWQEVPAPEFADVSST